VCPHCNLVYHKPSNTLYITASQKFHIRFSPFQVADAKYVSLKHLEFPVYCLTLFISLTVRITLRELEGKHYIAFQEDFYHTDELLQLLVPPLVPVARLALAGAGWISSFQATVSQVLGVWRPVK
jgi:hypothetical protein